MHGSGLQGRKAVSQTQVTIHPPLPRDLDTHPLFPASDPHFLAGRKLAKAVFFTLLSTQQKWFAGNNFFNEK